MITLPPQRRKRLFLIHSWTSVVTAIMLFVIIFTGACAVFARDELSAWAHAGQPAPVLAADMPIDATVRRLASEFQNEIGPAEEILVFAAQGRNPKINIGITRPHHQPDGDTQPASMVYTANAETGEIEQRIAGSIDWIFQRNWTSNIGTFLVHLHTDLWLPVPIGRYVTGIFGLALFVSLVSGLFIYRRILKDALLLRLERAAKVRWFDVHRLLGLWTIPFGLVCAFTGALLSFALPFLLPVAILTNFSGDAEQAEQAILAMDGRANIVAQTADIDALVADAESRAGGLAVDRIHILYLNDRNAVVDVVGYEQSATNLVTYRYDGATGNFEERLSGLLGDSLFNKLLGVAQSLHFADFGGTFVQLLWALLGICLAVVAVTGMLLWIERRISRGGDLKLSTYVAMKRTTLAICFGLPIAVLSLFYTERLVSGDLETRFAAMVGIFSLCWLLTAAFVFLAKPGVMMVRQLLIVSGIAALGIGILDAALGMPFWQLVSTRSQIAAGVDIALLAIGLIMLSIAALLPRQDAAKTQRQTMVSDDAAYQHHG